MPTTIATAIAAAYMIGSRKNPTSIFYIEINTLFEFIFFLSVLSFRLLFAPMMHPSHSNNYKNKSV